MAVVIGLFLGIVLVGGVVAISCIPAQRRDLARIKELEEVIKKRRDGEV